MFSNPLDDLAYRNGINTSRLTQEERRYLTSWLHYPWLEFDKHTIEEYIEEIDYFAVNHPNAEGVVNLIINSLRRDVIPRVS
jgi:hypothetical protein